MNIYEELGRVSTEHSIKKLQLKRLEKTCGARAKTTNFIVRLNPCQYGILKQLRLEVKSLNSKRIALLNKCRKECRLKDVNSSIEMWHGQLENIPTEGTWLLKHGEKVFDTSEIQTESAMSILHKGLTDAT